MAAQDPPEPIDKFTPHLLHVDADFHPAGEKHVAILTPGRAMVSIPAVPKDLVPPAMFSDVKTWLGSSPDIAVVSYTKLEALMDKDQGNLKCIPFLPRLCILAAAGYNVVVFEGHPSALESGLRDTDVLLIDSGRLPFIQEDWMKVAVRVMRPGARYFICRREKQNLLEVRPASQPPGWLYKQPDGETSYANCLLTVLGTRSGRSASLSTGRPVPDLRTMTDDRDELE